ncbi:MAG: hypothetical protein EB127_25645, partial [Alphaproteobacteria bacterium]|nr:hypothetical protein [Alphaproteobacteria bacterium]
NNRDESHNIPFQVQHLIDNMLNKTEKYYIRDNYRMRLESIRDSINTSLTKFKNEESLQETFRRNKR